MTEVRRSDGLTPSEQYLKRLCDRSFLTLWSYPNLYQDKGKGQELCDLLVVFGRHVIIFSDKSCKYPDTGKPQLDWSRWFKRSISASAAQVFGAERWLRSYADRIFLDAKCTQPFPLKLPDKEEVIFHRVVVALGAAERCRAMHGGSGSLMVAPLVMRDRPPDATPFAVGDIAPDRGFVHVLDDVTLDVVLQELDTAADFIAYLSAKEQFVRSGRLLMATGEEDLLAYYLQNINVHNQHEFTVPDEVEVIAIDESFWANLQSHPQYLAKRQADAVSYVWDRLVEAFTKNVVAGTLARGSELGIHAHEEALRVMASEPRIARRILGTAIAEKIESTPPGGESTRVIGAKQRPGVGYVFMLDSQSADDDYETYRNRRHQKLEAYCRAVKAKHSPFEQIVGIATEPRGSNGSSEDLIYIDTNDWTHEDHELASELHHVHGLLKNSHDVEVGTFEFPRVPSHPRPDPEATRRARNKRKKARQNGRR